MALPAPSAPMLAVTWPRPFSGEGWWFEPKWDGYRCLAHWDGQRLAVRSRTGKDLTHWFGTLPPPGERPVVLDGEIVALGPDGQPSFQALQRRTGMAPGDGGGGELAVFVFDVLGIDDRDLRGSPLSARLEALGQLDLRPPWHRSVGLEADGDAMWDVVVERGIEGMVAKRLDSSYHAGSRSPQWRKIVNRRSARTIVVGFTPGEGGRSSTFGSLVLAVHDDGGLRWVGQVGTGFDDTALRAIREALDEMVVDDPPFEVPREVMGSTWVEPRLVAHVEFREWTDEGRLRQPSFKGFGADDPDDVTWAAEGPGGDDPTGDVTGP